MMRVEGRYDLALSLLDDVIYEQRGVLGTALFVGTTVWGVISSLYYLAERNNKDMIYCGSAPASCYFQNESIDTSLCVIDGWGIVDCSAAGCENVDGKESCWNVYRSIVDSSFWTLLQLFGEFPLVDLHSAKGKILGTFTAVIACAVFALPAGIFASGFERQIALRRQKDLLQKKKSLEIPRHEYNSISNVENWCDRDLYCHGTQIPIRRKIYYVMHVENANGANSFEKVINALVVGSVITFMIDTVSSNIVPSMIFNPIEMFEFIAVTAFTLEYVLKIYSVSENPRYGGFKGRFEYAMGFMPLVDLLSFAPYWIVVIMRRTALFSKSDIRVKFLRLFRILKFERYTKAFSSFDDIVRDNLDVLGVTGFSAVVLWILFSVILYYSERDNPDSEMANYYKTVPHAMWVTLLNLSGECPLAHYTSWGKIMIGIMGLFATAVFGVPIGILGAGFEEKVEDKESDSVDAFDDAIIEYVADTQHGFQASCYQFVNGIGSRTAQLFELLIYGLILLTVVLGILQTLPGYEDLFQNLETVTVLVFTLEYIIRVVGVGADPEFNYGAKGGLRTRCDFIFSFYSFVDLLAILPFYFAYLMPGSWFDEHDEYLYVIPVTVYSSSIILESFSHIFFVLSCDQPDDTTASVTQAR
jgi:hypothetical protein